VAERGEEIDDGDYIMKSVLKILMAFLAHLTYIGISGPFLRIFPWGGHFL
jgi:hypothetical protein